MKRSPRSIWLVHAAMVLPAFFLVALLSEPWQLLGTFIGLPHWLADGVGIVAALLVAGAIESRVAHSHTLVLQPLAGLTPGPTPEQEERLRRDDEDRRDWARLLAEHGIQPAGGVELCRQRLELFARLAGERAELARGHGEVASICDLLGRHLTEVVRQTEQAAMAILAGLKTIDGAVEETLFFIRASDRQSHDFVANAQQQIDTNLGLMSKLGSHLEHRLASLERDRANFEALVEESDTLDSATSSVAVIAQRTNMLALNATVEATRAGEFGRGFAVVASEVKQLSRASTEASASIHTGIEKMKGAIQALIDDTHLAERATAEQVVLAELSDHLQAIADSYGTMTAYQTQMLSDLDGRGQQVAQTIMAALSAVQFQDIVRQQVGTVIEALEALAAHHRTSAEALARLGEPSLLPDAGKLAEQLQQRYVMQVQHNTHSNAASPGASLPDIELF